MENYCSCYQKDIEKNKKKMKVSGIEWRFNSKEIRFKTADSCAMEHFSAHALYHNYYIMVQTHMRVTVAQKISERMTRGMRTLASTNSIRSRQFCLENKVLNHCSKIKSLRNTYSCINKTFSHLNKLDRFEAQCPGLQNKDNHSFTGELRL